MSWTPEELAAMAEADAEIDEEFELTDEDLELSAAIDADIRINRSTAPRKSLAKYRAEYFKRNREQIYAKRRARRQAHLDKSRAKEQAYRDANRDHVRRVKKTWYEENKADQLAKQKARRGEINARRRELYKENPELRRDQNRAYYQAHKNELNAKRRERNAKKKAEQAKQEGECK